MRLLSLQARKNDKRLSHQNYCIVRTLYNGGVGAFLWGGGGVIKIPAPPPPQIPSLPGACPPANPHLTTPSLPPIVFNFGIFPPTPPPQKKMK